MLGQQPVVYQTNPRFEVSCLQRAVDSQRQCNITSAENHRGMVCNTAQPHPSAEVNDALELCVGLMMLCLPASWMGAQRSTIAIQKNSSDVGLGPLRDGRVSQTTQQLEAEAHLER